MVLRQRSYRCNRHMICTELIDISMCSQTSISGEVSGLSVGVWLMMRTDSIINTLVLIIEFSLGSTWYRFKLLLLIVGG